ncbi:MAG: selenide, water dikinase SelD, partial [Actinomycetota bacterium]
MTTTEPIKLTSLSHGAGCACKLPLADLGEVLALLGEGGPQDGTGLDPRPDILVGLDEADDAAVVRMSDDEAIVLTLDFFTPLVDDAYTWGRIAATNAASDVYAMGGTPIVGLNIVAWPRELLPLEMLADVLRGGRAAASDGGFLIVGGHSVDDPEPKYGMVVVGRAHPDRLMTIDRAEPGDVLILTKPLGTGIVTTAIKRDASTDEATDAAIYAMTTLNASASCVFVEHGVRACTDVTGFGLLGHLHRMLVASSVSASIDASAVPLLPGVRELVADGQIPGGTKRNLETVDPQISWDGAGDLTRIVLADAQTSGGLLAACPADGVASIRAALAGELACAVIGTIGDG